MDDRVIPQSFDEWFDSLPTVAQGDVLDELRAAIRELDTAILRRAIDGQPLAPQPSLDGQPRFTTQRSLN